MQIQEFDVNSHKHSKVHSALSSTRKSATVRTWSLSYTISSVSFIKLLKKSYKHLIKNIIVIRTLTNQVCCSHIVATANNKSLVTNSLTKYSFFMEFQTYMGCVKGLNPQMSTPFTNMLFQLQRDV